MHIKSKNRLKCVKQKQKHFKVLEKVKWYFKVQTRVYLILLCSLLNIIKQLINQKDRLNNTNSIGPLLAEWYNFC